MLIMDNEGNNLPVLHHSNFTVNTTVAQIPWELGVAIPELGIGDCFAELEPMNMKMY